LLFLPKKLGEENNAICTLNNWTKAFHMLADTPLAGKACDNIKAGYKKFPQGSHIIFYKVGSQTSIEIIRILHKHMDVDAQLSP
jgi:toxin ParE1/3/4